MLTVDHGDLGEAGESGRSVRRMGFEVVFCCKCSLEPSTPTSQHDLSYGGVLEINRRRPSQSRIFSCTAGRTLQASVLLFVQVLELDFTASWCHTKSRFLSCRLTALRNLQIEEFRIGGCYICNTHFNASKLYPSL